MGEQPATGKWQVWLMMAIVIGVILAGFLVFPKTQQQRDQLLAKLGTTNHGVFVVPPSPISNMPLTDLDGSPWHVDQQKAKWRLVVAGDAECLGECREMLHLTRQVHIRLGKYSRRFERLYILLDAETLGSEAAEHIDSQHPFLTVLKGRTDDFSKLLESTNADWQAGTIRAFVADQQGLVMMYYSLDHSGGDILEDLNHLMKYSAGE